MELRAGDLVAIVALPSRVDQLPATERQVYQACLGFKLAISRIDEGGHCVVQLHQEWSHFPGVTPFDLTFDATCLRKLVPFSDSEWALLSDWMQRDARLSGDVHTADGHLKVHLEAGIVGDLSLPPDASPTDYLGKTIPVRIIMLNRKKRDLVLHPAPP